jgi:cell division septation protein DedD
MDQHAGGTQAWFDEVLRRSGIDAASVIRADSPRRPAVQRSNPWEETDGIEAAAQILGSARGPGNEAGHMIFVTDVEEDPVARVQAAVQIGRAAVGQGLDVLMIDADVRQVGLSRWLPDRDLDSEGLVDVLQYGASVAVARRSSVVDGIDVLGIGSYRPEASSVFESDDLRRLCVQVRSSAGLVVVVGAARLTEGQFHPLIGEADSVAVSMHLDRELAAPLGEFLEYVVGLKMPVAGMFLWAGPDDAEQFVDDALLERSRVLPRADVDSPFPRRGSSMPDPPEVESGPGFLDVFGEEVAVTVPLPPVDAETVDRPVIEPVIESADPPDIGPTSVRIKTERVSPGSRSKLEGSKRGGSSGAIRGIMAVVGVAIVGFAAWWAFTWQNAGPTRPRVQPPERPVVAAQMTESDEPDTTLDSATLSPPGAAGSTSAGDGPADAGTGEEVETSRDVDGLLAEPVENGPGLTQPEREEPAARIDPFETAMRRRGRSGWALHLFSFPDSMEAVTDSRRLRSDGYAVTIHGAKIKGRRWYRVLVGTFDTRGEAARYRVQAQEKFGVDWVGVEKK